MAYCFMCRREIGNSNRFEDSRIYLNPVKVGVEVLSTPLCLMCKSAQFIPVNVYGNRLNSDGVGWEPPKIVPKILVRY